MPNDSDVKQLAELEGVPPKLYKLALGASAGALVMVLVVIGGIVWRLNSDCPAVQRDVRIALDHIGEHSISLNELQRATPAITREEWRDVWNRLIRLEAAREADDGQVRQIEADLRAMNPWRPAAP